MSVEDRELIIPGDPAIADRTLVIPDNQNTKPPEIILAGQTETTDPAEAKARAEGWVPKEEFKGDPEKWKPADQWLAFGNDQKNVLKDRVARLEQKLADQQAKYEASLKLQEKTRQFLLEQNKQQRAQLEAAEAQVKQVHRQAIRESNDSLADEAEAQLEQIRQQKNQLAEQEKAEQQQQADPEVLMDQVTGKPLPFKRAEGMAWIAQNPEIKNDPRLQDVTNTVSRKLQAMRPDLQGAEFLSTLTATVKATYPELFAAGTQRQSRVSTPVATAAPTAAKAKFDTLSATDKKMAQDLVDAGVFKTVYDFAATIPD